MYISAQHPHLPLLTVSDLTSDFSTIMIGALHNNGWATVINFAPKTFSSLTLLVTSVSSTTDNVGLSEIQVYGPAVTASPSPPSTPASTPPPPSPASSTATTSSSCACPSTSPNVDLAIVAVATSSSGAQSQGPEKAIDGVVAGYLPAGGDYTKEWASNGQGVGATLTLTWAQTVTAGRLVLFDRPNLFDQILDSSIQFS